MINVYTSTLKTPTEEKDFDLHFFAGESSMSFINKSLFDPPIIKEVVNSLVMSKYSTCFKRTRKRFHASGSSVVNTNSLSSEFEGHQEYSPFDSDLTIYTSNMSLLVSADCLKKHDLDMVPIYKKLSTAVQQKDQILKAIFFDEINKKKRLTMERIEAEKLLLTLDVTSQTLLKTVKTGLNEPKLDDSYTATINISRLQFWISDSKCLNGYFFALLTHGSQVYPTEVAKAKFNGMVHFKKDFFVEYCTKSSKIGLSLYAISSDIKISKWTSKHIVCHHQKLDIRYLDVPKRSSSFQLFNNIEFSIEDLKSLSISKNPKWLENCWFKLDINIKTDLDLVQSGFVNVSQKVVGYPVWNTQWCVLQENVLKLYNYPSDELPKEIINLTDCMEVKLLSRLECPRGNAILLATNTGKKYLICCNSAEECYQWEYALREGLSSVKTWAIHC